MDYKGYEIKRVMFEDSICYTVPGLPSLSGVDIAANIKTAMKWIDAYLQERAYFKYLREKEVNNEGL